MNQAPRADAVEGALAIDRATRRAARATTYHRLLTIKYRLPEWLRYRLDPYNTAADRFIASAGTTLPAGARVLDAGAGECRHGEYFRHVHYFGTDNQRGDDVEFDYGRVHFVSDIAMLPVGSGRLDAVVSVNVLEHVADPEAILRECRRVLRPGGHLFLVAPQSWRLHQAPQDFLRFTRYGLEHLLGRAGFVPERIEPLGGAFWNLGLRSLYVLTHFRGPLFPIALLLAPLFGFLVPLTCFYLDRIDRRKEDTLGYTVVARASGG